MICAHSEDKKKIEAVKDRDNREMIAKLLVISPEEINQSGIDKLISANFDSA